MAHAVSSQNEEVMFNRQLVLQPVQEFDAFEMQSCLSRHGLSVVTDCIRLWRTCFSSMTYEVCPLLSVLCILQFVSSSRGDNTPVGRGGWTRSPRLSKFLKDRLLWLSEFVSRVIHVYRPDEAHVQRHAQTHRHADTRTHSHRDIQRLSETEGETDTRET